MMFRPVFPAFIIYILAIALVAFTIFCIIKPKYRKMRFFRRIGIVALLLLALLRPTLSGGSAERELSNLNIFFLVDNTGSMATRDMDNNTKFRYEKIANDITRIAELFPGAKYSIISLDFQVYQAMPLTINLDTVASFAKTLKPKYSYYTSDSNLSSIFDYAYKRMKQYSERYTDRKNVLIFMSDGEENTTGGTKVPDDMRNLVSGGAIIGYGTTNGARVNSINNNGEIQENDFIKDSTTKKEHISRMDEKNLENIANSLSIHYYRRASSEEKFNSINSFIDNSALYSKGDDKKNVGTDIYWLFMLFALVLLFWDFSTILSNLLLERKAVK